MNVILIAGFWLQGDSWNEVAAPLRAAGLTVLTPTLEGLHSVDDDRSGVTLASQTAEVVALVDSLDPHEALVLVGHSGGGAIIHGAVDARPERVTRAIYVDSGPTPEGEAINASIPAVGADVPLLSWDDLGEDSTRDLTDELKQHFRAIAIPQPEHVAHDKQRLSNPARYDVPITIISSTLTRAEMDEYIGAGVPAFSEVPRTADVTIVELPTGHWPQFTKPQELAAEIMKAVGR